MSHRHRLGHTAATSAMLIALTRYLTTIVPPARAEIARWRVAAAGIPNGELRQLATATINEEHLNAEAAAVFSLLAPRARRRAVVQLLVAWQLMYDYLDTISERDLPNPLERSLRLHQALIESVQPPGTSSTAQLDDDGGYLASLIETCRARLWALPAAVSIAPVAAQEARRCGQAQSHTHAAMLTGDHDPLQQWGAADRTEHGMEWWESAAGGVSSLAVHALLASAGDDAVQRVDALEIAYAYGPICALSTLLDSLVDVADDRESGNFSFFALYPDEHAAAAGMTALASSSAAGTLALRRASTHRVIVAGLAAFYLSDAAARASPEAAVAADAVIAELSPAVQPALRLLRVRRLASAP